ncbi:monofunctional biosynthetic peptidoglycan transglycosylase [Chachezhania sediminis]|uniref:monofunctional biosynthetic peptidoglycan transglycosylase n=1 Tax=Chachezhania sediminis TaxID=2599291 RepID=UPI00131CDA57|nr:monofunctional biosynthetic peptidoglycan transglycosylase [Chachezhania sediminis]
MARRKAEPEEQKPRRRPRADRRPVRWLLRWTRRAVVFCLVMIATLILIYSKVNPPTTLTMLEERRQRGSVQHFWVSMDDIAPVMARSVVAAEDANFCRHWGFDVKAIKMAMADGAVRGASTLSQQVTKNVFLWQGRSWIRKVLEAGLTPLVELVWSKRRIVEVYLNVAEMGPGIFGVGAAAKAYFNTTPDRLTARQAAQLAAVLPDPKRRDPANPTQWLKKRAARIADGAATIAADGRAACFED